MKKLTIVIGGSMESDFSELFSEKSSIQDKNILYLESYEQLNRFLSPKKLDLLNYLIGLKKLKSVSELAKILKRKQEAISRDIAYLKNHDLISLNKIKQSVYASSIYSNITIKTS